MANLQPAASRGRSPLRVFGPAWAVVIGLLGAGLGAAPAVAQTALPPNYATQPFTPRDFKMPGGGGCSGDIARWQALQDNDYASGNVSPKVYRQIRGEVAQAESACAAGHDARARAMVSASKRRHGYPG